jgi:dipeptidase D
MDNLKGGSELKPKNFWKHFDKILSIPHPSGHEKGLIEYLKKFSDKLNLKYEVDTVGNVLIKKPASSTKKTYSTVVLQAHLDMVPQKNFGSTHDFLKDSISAYLDEGWIKANGTTLGADNATGVASIMSILEDQTIEHGPIEALLTVEEEVGLRGAAKLKSGILNGKYMINLDGGPDDVFVIGCAGGVNTEVTFNYTPVKNVDIKNCNFIKFMVKGLKGGHSGDDVQCQRGNSNKILFRVLYRLNKKFDIKISDIDSGGLRNAIPREGFAIFGFDKTKEKAVIETITFEMNIIKSELQSIDPGLYFERENLSAPEFLLDKGVQNNLIASIHACHNGIIRVFDDATAAVQTSTNLALVRLDKISKTVKVIFMTRSAMQSEKNTFCERLDALFKLAGASNIKQIDSYSGWLPDRQSILLSTASDVYKRMFSVVPKQKITHGGLECGIIGGLYPGMDMIAIGPNMEGLHSPDEKVEVASMEKNYNFLVELLAVL